MAWPPFRGNNGELRPEAPLQMRASSRRRDEALTLQLWLRKKFGLLGRSNVMVRRWLRGAHEKAQGGEAVGLGIPSMHQRQGNRQICVGPAPLGCLTNNYTHEYMNSG